MNVCIVVVVVVFAVVLIFITIPADSEKIVKWKSGIKAKHLKVNTVKMKVMLSCNRTNKVEEKGKWPYSICKKVVGNNSMLCTIYQK